MLGKDLQKVSTLVEIDQDVEFLEDIHVGGEGPRHAGESLAEVGIVCGGDLEELDTAGLEIGDGGDDVVRAEGDVLDAGTVIVVHKSGLVNVLCLRMGEGEDCRTPLFETSFFLPQARSWAS